MCQAVHASATTTETVRRAIQHSQKSLRALAKRYGINQKTVAKWKGRASVLRSSDRAEGARVNSPDRGGRGRCRRLPKAYPAAARRLSLRAPADDPAPDALVAPSLSATPRHHPIASNGRRQGAAEEAQGLSDRLLPCQQYQSVASARVRLLFKSGLGSVADDNVSHRRQFA